MPDRPIDATSGEAVVQARELTMAFDGTDVVTGIDLDLAPGTILGLIGPSGCGKTTTVRMMTGLLRPTRGRALVHGVPATELSRGQRKRIGYLPQTPALFPELSLIENLSFHASMYGLPFRRSERLDDVLEWVELSDDRSKRVCDASGGMQRRLALAAAFVHDPDLLFLDEPTAGIDPILRDRLWQQFHRAADSGKSLVVTTQYVGEAGKCDLVGLLSEGELLLLDTPDNLRRAAFDGEVVDVELDRPLSESELHRLEAHADVVGAIERTGPLGLRIVADDADRVMAWLPDTVGELGASIDEMDEHVVDYDEAFVRVVQQHRSGDDVRAEPRPARPTGATLPPPAAREETAGAR